MKPNNNKKIDKTILIFITLFVVICCSVLYKRSFIDFGYLLVVIVYFSRYLYLQKKSIS